MSLNDYLKCPGLEHTLAVRPQEYPCPACGQRVEIWTDEQRRRCANCGALVVNPNFAAPAGPPEELMQLTAQALKLGASGAALIDSAEIIVEKELAAICAGEPRCKNYGTAPSCPPHVGGPDAFKKWRDLSSHALVVRIDVPQSIMFSENQREVMRLLQENLAALEKSAVEMGYSRSKAFAGGSCKNVWCSDKADCRVLAQNGPCRFADKARPSMSGFGVNVAQLMESAGWPNKKALSSRTAPSQDSLWIAGMVLFIK